MGFEMMSATSFHVDLIHVVLHALMVKEVQFSTYSSLLDESMASGLVTNQYHFSSICSWEPEIALCGFVRFLVMLRCLIYLIGYSIL